MGIVYLAFDPHLARKVALEVVRRPDTSSGGTESSAYERLTAQINSEAKSLASLTHPNVLAVFDVGTHEGEPFMATEFIDGVVLTHWVRDRQRPWREVVGVLIRVGRGLVGAHQIGLIHRDVKPDNVIIDDAAQPHLLDFGLAAPTQPLREVSSGGWLDENELTGTPSYMAPEQFSGHAADQKSDQYAFCVTLWVCLTGELPFTGEDVVAQRDAKLSGMGALDLRSHVACPRRLSEIIVRGLAPDPCQRYLTMSALLEELDDLLTSQRRFVQRGVALTMATLVVSALSRAAAHQIASEDTCEVGRASWRAEWNEDRRALIGTAFAKVDPALGSDTWQVVARAMDDGVLEPYRRLNPATDTLRTSGVSAGSPATATTTCSPSSSHCP